jgi:hypothetical protein
MTPNRHLAQPIEDDQLQLGRGRGGLPEHGVDVEGCGQRLGEDGGAGRGVGEVGEEAGVVPVGEAGYDHALDVGQDLLQRLAAEGRSGGQRRADLSGAHAREDRVALRSLEVA